MKMFRRISALALVAVMICLFSASAFAATSFSDLKMYDDGETYVDAYANIYQKSTSGTITLTAVGLQSHRLEAAVTYYFTPVSGTENSGYASAVETVDVACSVSSAGKSKLIGTMVEAQYTFYAQFTSWIGENEYISGTQRLTY